MAGNNNLNLGLTALPVTLGGTGLATATTAYALVTAGTTATGNFQVLSSLGSSNQGLLSGGPAASPSWGTVVTSITGTSNRLSVGGTGAVPILDIDTGYVGQASITTLGTIGTGTWNGGVIVGTYGGTGVNNGSSTITIGGNTEFSGGFTFKGTVTGNTSVTFPTSGTLSTTTGTVTSVSGTAARISSTGGVTPVLDIDATYVGQSSIVTLGTVTTGTWSATDVDVAAGGTGVSTMTTAYVPVCAGTTATGALQVASTGLATAGWVLMSNGAAALPSFQAPPGGVSSVSGTAARISSTGGGTPVIDIDASYVGQSSITTLGTITTGVWTGTDVAVTDGGTGVSTMTTAYAPVCSGTTATGALQVASTGLSTAGYVLVSNGASALPSFQVGPGTSPLIYKKITLSSANITGMRATPVELVAAPGANKLLIVHRFAFEKKYNSVAYTSGGTVFIQWDTTANGAGVSAAGTLSAATVTGTTDVHQSAVCSVAASVAASTTVNKSLCITNNTGAFATGNSTCYVHLYYSILDTTI